MLDGSYSVVPQVHLGYVTVKDTARAHIAAMTHPDANGKDLSYQRGTCG